MRRLSTDQAGCLVAVGIGTIFVLLALPAIIPFHTVQVRIRCSEKFQKLGLALHGFADTHGYFPNATVPNANLPPHRRLSWHVAVLPSLDANHIQTQVVPANTWDSPTNRAVLSIPFDPFRCSQIKSSDPRPITTFAGLAGVGSDSPTLPVHHPRAGVFGDDRRVRFWSIKDGTSSTIFVMEYGREPGPWAKGGEGTITWFDPSDPPHSGPGRPLGLPHWEPPYGRVGLVLMGDGMSRTVSGKISPAVLEALATIAGGESVEIP